MVGKVRLVGAAYLVVWLDGQCGQVGQVVRMLESSSQDDYMIFILVHNRGTNLKINGLRK